MSLRFTAAALLALMAGALYAQDARIAEETATAAPRRPQLSAEQARSYDYREVLKATGRAGAETLDPWDPLADPLAQGAQFRADYTVDAAAAADGVRTFSTVQAAISRAVSDIAAQAVHADRVYILVKPGTYKELVYIPAAAVPITLYGQGRDAAATRIAAGLDAAVSSASYAQQFGPQFANVHPSIQEMHALIKARTNISTSGSPTVWVRNKGFQARNITFENSYNKATGNAGDECSERACGNAAVDAQVTKVHHQAVALLVEGADKAQFENIRLIGFQDTLYLKSVEARMTARSFFNKSYIEGDVDFIFGDTTAFFYQSEIKSLGDRSTSYVAAPNTNWKTKYGLVFDRCRFTSDGSPFAQQGNFYLARQWFNNSRCTPYGKVPLEGYNCTLGTENVYEAPRGSITLTALETVGKAVVLNSSIGKHIHRNTPWSDWNRKGTLPYRPAQFTSDDYWNNLRQAGIEPVKHLGYTKQPSPADIYLAEFNNSVE